MSWFCQISHSAQSLQYKQRSTLLRDFFRTFWKYHRKKQSFLGKVQRSLAYLQSCMNPKLYQKLDCMVFRFVISNLSATTAKNCAENKHQLRLKKKQKKLNMAGLHTQIVLIEIIFSQCGYFDSVNCPRK